MVTNAHRTVVMKRDMIYVDQVLSSGENDSYRIFQRHISFDGKQTTAVGAPPGRATITKGRSRELDTQTIGFFTVNLLNPPGLPRSLLGLLQHTPYNIRKDVELIDGHPCQVLEFSEFVGDTMNIWLDLERGLLPIRHRSFRPDGQLWFECNVEKAAEVEKGLWFATRAHCTTFPVFKNLAELAGGIEQVIILDGDSKGLPLILVNQDPDDSIFDLASNLPVGTQVANMDEDRQWRIVGFSKDKKPATKPAASAQPAPPPLMAAPLIAPERKVEFDLKGWGDAVQGVSLRFRLGKENGPGSPYLDIKNSSQQNLKYDFGRPRLEFDQKWYLREDENERLIDLSAGRTYQAIGPIFLGARWIGEQERQRLIKAAGKHTIRVKFIAQPADGKGKPIEVITAPLIIELDAQGISTTQPAQ